MKERERNFSFLDFSFSTTRLKALTLLVDRGHGGNKIQKIFTSTQLNDTDGKLGYGTNTGRTYQEEEQKDVGMVGQYWDVRLHY